MQPKTVLITGAGQRIGRHLAKTFAQTGWRVVVHANNSIAQAKDLAATLPGEHSAIHANLAAPNASQHLIAEALAMAGHIDCLINCAGTFVDDTADTMTQAGLVDAFTINALAPILLATALYQQLPSERRSAVIHFLDQRVGNLSPDNLSYSLSKLALANSLRVTAMAMAPKLRINAIAPGLTLPSGNQTVEQFAIAHNRAALGQSSTPEDLSHAALFLANAPAITGQTLIVDGGQHLIPTLEDFCK